MVKRYYNIKVDIPKKEILKRLHITNNMENFTHQKRSEIESLIVSSFNRCELKACYKRFSVTSNEDGIVTLDNRVNFISNHFSIYIGMAKEVFLFSVTVGKDIIDYRDQFILKEEALFALVTDAVGSETVEEGVNELQSTLEKSLMREGKTLKKSRYSVGYGDFDIKNQKDIYNELELDKLDIKITESNILLPEKTVTAFCTILDK